MRVRLTPQRSANGPVTFRGVAEIGLLWPASNFDLFNHVPDCSPSRGGGASNKQHSLLQEAQYDALHSRAAYQSSSPCQSSRPEGTNTSIANSVVRNGKATTTASYSSCRSERCSPDSLVAINCRLRLASDTLCSRGSTWDRCAWVAQHPLSMDPVLTLGRAQV